MIKIENLKRSKNSSGELVLTSRVISEGLNYDYSSTLKLAKKLTEAGIISNHLEYNYLEASILELAYEVNYLKTFLNSNNPGTVKAGEDRLEVLEDEFLNSIAPYKKYPKSRLSIVSKVKKLWLD